MNAKKLLLIAAAVLILAGIVVASILHGQSSVTKVATGKVARQDLVSIVSGTGQIKPKTYVNVGAETIGRITRLNVKEGDRVKQGAILANIESVQAESAVSAQRASIESSKTDVSSFEAAEKTAAANIAQGTADLEQKRLDFERSRSLYQEKLIAKQDFDARQAAFDMANATLAQRQAALVQARAQTASQRAHVNQAVASQRGNFNALDKTIARAPFDGLVTNVPVREGETVVVGIQNAGGSTIMTLADMSVITAEVKVDETDIVYVRKDQPVDVTVDALPGRTFKGHVTEVGDQALLRTTGLSTTQSTTGTEEAKDFKVVVTLDQASGESNDDLRPGLSATAKITTAHKADAVTIPIQALVQRDPVAEKTLADHAGKPSTNAVAAATTTSKPKMVQGVYLLTMDHGKQRAVFTPVTTGITGATDIEVLTGLKAAQEIVTGRYTVLRSLHSGTVVKRDNSVDTEVPKT